MRNLLFLLLITSVFACKMDNKSKDGLTVEDITILPDNSTATNPEKLSIPNACELITEANIESIFKLTGTAVRLKEANDPGNLKTKSCFFQWDDAGTPNAGILIQVSTNPVYDEFQEYISNFVIAKITEGESVLGSDAPSRYKKFSVGGSTGAYSFDQSRFYWSKGNDYLFMLAFNVTTLSEAKMVDAATAIIEEVNKNFAAKVSQ